MLVNETKWNGISLFTFDVGMHPPMGSTIVCKVYKVPSSCISICAAKIYYILAKDHITRACIHLGSHFHPMKSREYRNSIEKIRSLVGEQVEQMPIATNSIIMLEVGKELVGKLRLHPEDALEKILDLHELIPMLNKCKHLISSSIRNNITTF
jgi:hypothetical protein